MGQIICSTACLKEFIWTSDLEMGGGGERSLPQKFNDKFIIPIRIKL